MIRVLVPICNLKSQIYNPKGGVEQVCRYVLRHPFAEDRLERLPDDRIRYRFIHPKPDGATHAIFTPVEFLEKLVALIPPPRAHLVRYHGILAPNHRWRPNAVPVVRPKKFIEECRHDSGTPAGPAMTQHNPELGRGGSRPAPTIYENVQSPKSLVSGREEDDSEGPGTVGAPVGDWKERPQGWRKGRPHMDWAQLLKRSMNLDALDCPECGEKMTMIAVIKDPEVAKKILTAMGLPAVAPVARPPPRKEAVEIVQDREINIPGYEGDRDFDQG